MSEYVCLPCGFVYFEPNGENQKDPKRQARKFDELPINWACPDCGSLKYDFEKVEDENEDESR